MLVELKSGETLNGHLVNCDAWMNLTLKEVVQTNSVCISFFSASSIKTLSVNMANFAKDGSRFFRLAEAYVRGNNVCWIIAFIDIS